VDRIPGILQVRQLAGAGGTGFAAGRRQPFGDAVITQGALVGDVFGGMQITASIRARLNAIAATNAILLIYQHDAVRRQVRRTHRARLDAGGVGAVIAEFRNEEALHSGRIPSREAMYATLGRFHLGMLHVLAVDFVALYPGAKESLRHVVLYRAGADAVAASNTLLDVDGHGPPMVCHSVFRIRCHSTRRAFESFQSGSRKDHELSRCGQQFASTQFHGFSSHIRG